MKLKIIHHWRSIINIIIRPDDDVDDGGVSYVIIMMLLVFSCRCVLGVQKKDNNDDFYDEHYDDDYIVTCFLLHCLCLVCSRIPLVSRHCTAASPPHSSRTSMYHRHLTF